MRKMMPFHLLFITFTMIYAANIPPAAVFEDNDSISAPNDFMFGRSDSNEKYLTRDKYSKQLEPSMDTYVATYRKYHEKYQTAEEKSSDIINRENQNTIDHKVVKRSAPTNPPTPPREMFKFELSDAKVPDFMTKTLMPTKVPPQVADAVYDATTQATEPDAKASGSRIIKIVHPISTKHARPGRGISLEGFTAPVSKASFKLYLSDKHNPVSYKGLFNPVSTRTRYATNYKNFSQADKVTSVGSGQNLVGPLQTPGLMEYSGKNWFTVQDLTKAKRPQARPVVQYVQTIKKPPQYGYTIPTVKDYSSLSSPLSVNSFAVEKPKAYTPIHEGTTASEGNKFGEPFRSSLLDPTFSVDGESLAALTALIGKAPTIQLKEFDELLKKDKVTRPQDSTSPILFHPTTETNFGASTVPSTTPTSVDYYPESPVVRLNFEDITRFYGGGNLPTPFAPSDDHKPIFETVTERPLRPTPPPILISPAAVTVRTPEDVLQIPQEFQASALVDQGDSEEDKHVSRGFGKGGRYKRNARELRNIPVRDIRNSFDPLVLQEAFPIIGNRDILMTPLPLKLPKNEWGPVEHLSTFMSRYLNYLRRKNNAFLRTINAEIPFRTFDGSEGRVRRSAKDATLAFKELANETLSHLTLKDFQLKDPDGDKATNSEEYLDYDNDYFDENATLSEDFPDYPFDPVDLANATMPQNRNSSRRYDYYEYPEDVELDDSFEHNNEFIEHDHSHKIEYKLVPVTVYKKVPVLKLKKKHPKIPKWHPPKRFPRFRKHKRRHRRPRRYKKFRPLPKPFKLLHH